MKKCSPLLKKILPILTLFSLTIIKQSIALAEIDLRFNSQCDRTEDINIVAVGDILLHEDLQTQATKETHRFQSIWSPVLPIIKNADIAYANLEGPVAFRTDVMGKETENSDFIYDGKAYTSYPQFNYHPYLIDDIASSGFDVVSTANNHALDRRAVGIDKTIDKLNQQNILFSGTRKQMFGTVDEYEWQTITESKGRKIAWISCTFSTNGIPDKFKQVLMCYTDTTKIINMIKKLNSNPEIDAVIVTPHWGDEYQLKPNQSQIKLGRLFIEEGATAVIGTHPHVIQPWEKYTTKDGREGFIIYSTGNFISGQKPIERSTSTLIKLTLTGEPNSKLKIRGVGHLPLYLFRNKLSQVNPIFDYKNLPETSVNIWKNAFSERLRIKSINENEYNRICN